jgi:hypothetical protein
MEAEKTDVAESFRWRDQGNTGFTTGVWDIAAGAAEPAAAFEPVENFGATGYRIERE